MNQRKAFLMRIDPALWAELESWAQAELRSVNGQIEMILRQAILKRKGSRSQPEQVTVRRKNVRGTAQVVFPK
jgi:hypothetical protein